MTGRMPSAAGRPLHQRHDAACLAGEALDSALRGGGSRGRGACRTAGGGEGEGGETMPDAETSPLHPDEPPAAISIEGKARQCR